MCVQTGEWRGVGKKRGEISFWRGGKPLQDLKTFKKFCQVGENGVGDCLFPEPLSELDEVINVDICLGQRAWCGVEARRT